MALEHVGLNILYLLSGLEILKIRNTIFGDSIDYFLKRNIQIYYMWRMVDGTIQILNHQKIYIKKFTNYAHYLEFELSKTTLNDIRNMIKNHKAIYNHNVDQRKNKFDGAIKLYKFNKKDWPIYLKQNYSKYKNWLV